MPLSLKISVHVPPSRCVSSSPGRSNSAFFAASPGGRLIATDADSGLSSARALSLEYASVLRQTVTFGWS